jgi:hypothetical protein
MIINASRFSPKVSAVFIRLSLQSDVKKIKKIYNKYEGKYARWV